MGTTATVYRVERTVLVPNEVTIAMSYQDARDIMAICATISGNPSGPRGSVSRLHSALLVAGVEPGRVKQLFKGDRDSLGSPHYELEEEEK